MSSFDQKYIEREHINRVNAPEIEKARARLDAIWWPKSVEPPKVEQVSVEPKPAAKKFTCGLKNAYHQGE